MTVRHILVTGATGGLGGAVVREVLERGHRVRATGRSREAGRELRALGAEFVAADLVDDSTDIAALLAGCHSVIHAAGFSASWGPPERFERANVTATRRLLEAAEAAGLERFVFVSSPSIYAAHRDRVSIPEGAAPTLPPLNDYARTKLAAERFVLAPRNSDIACCAIRPRALVGDGDRVILPRLAEFARRRVMPLPGGGRAMIELTDLRDAAWAICEAEARAPDIAGKGINVSGGRPVPIGKLALRLADALGEKPRLVSIPLPVARALAVTLEKVALWRGSEDEPVMTRYTLGTLGWSQTFDLAPAERLLGYRPRYDANETVLAEARKLAGAA